MIIVANLILRTEIDTSRFDKDAFSDETPQEIMESLLQEGFHQYSKDYDYDVVYQTPEVQVVQVDRRTERD